jgi:hypothetical protein
LQMVKALKMNVTKKKVTLIHKIPQTADRLGRTLDNLGKDFLTTASGKVGVGDSAEVYALSFSN